MLVLWLLSVFTLAGAALVAVLWVLGSPFACSIDMCGPDEITLHLPGISLKELVSISHGQSLEQLLT